VLSSSVGEEGGDVNNDKEGTTAMTTTAVATVPLVNSDCQSRKTSLFSLFFNPQGAEGGESELAVKIMTTGNHSSLTFEEL